jgi:hypothetical protein
MFLWINRIDLGPTKYLVMTDQVNGLKRQYYEI